MAMMTGGEAIVRTLLANGAETVFGIPGLHTLAIYDALFDHPNLRHILVRNEQAASIMANAVGRITGHPGICLVTTGPAACNALIGVADATRESTPMLVVASQIDSGLVGQGKGAFHEMSDQKGMFQAAGAWTVHVNRVEQIPAAINAAWVAMTHARPRPAYVEIPEDILGAKAEVQAATAPDAPQIGVSRQKATALIEAVRRARRPLVYVGGGAARSGAANELRAFVERLDLPVVATINGKGVLAEDHRLSAGVAPVKDPRFKALLPTVDLLVSLGAGFGQVSTYSWSVAWPAQVIQVDVDGSQIGKNIPATTGVVGDVKTVLAQLNSVEVDTHPAANTKWVAEVKSLSDQVRRSEEDYPGCDFARIMRDVLPRNTVVVGDAQSWGTWLIHHYPVYAPGQLIWPINFGTLGYSIPGALGVKAACPDCPVVAACGDGGFTFYANEFATAAQHGLNIIVLVVNNSSLSVIRALQTRIYGPQRVFAADLQNPDFEAYARAFGWFAVKINTLSDLAESLREALQVGRPALIEIPFDIKTPESG